MIFIMKSKNHFLLIGHQPRDLICTQINHWLIHIKFIMVGNFTISKYRFKSRTYMCHTGNKNNHYTNCLSC